MDADRADDRELGLAVQAAARDRGAQLRQRRVVDGRAEEVGRVAHVRRVAADEVVA